MINKIKRALDSNTAGKLVSILTLSVILLTSLLYLKFQNDTMRLQIDEHNNEIEELERKDEELYGFDNILIEKTENLQNQINTLNEVANNNLNARPVIFSNYAVDDGSGVGDTGAYGIGIKDFTTNTRGWHLYDGKVALACAHETMGGLRSGYRYWDKLEEITFLFEGHLFEGICVDKGGAMQGFGNETEQRIDIWVDSIEYSFGLKTGYAYE